MLSDFSKSICYLLSRVTPRIFEIRKSVICYLRRGGGWEAGLGVGVGGGGGSGGVSARGKHYHELNTKAHTVHIELERCMTQHEWKFDSELKTVRISVMSMLLLLLLITLTTFIRHVVARFRSQTLNGPFSAVSTPIFAINSSLETS